MTITVGLLVVLVQLILYFAFKNFLPTFFSEKGKNLATIQDIDKITSIVESTKIVFSKDLELLKSQFQVMVNKEIGLINEERDAIIQINDDLSKWIDFCSDLALGGINDFENAEIDRRKLELLMAHDRVSVSASRFSLIVEDDLLDESLTQVRLKISETLQLRHEKYLFELKELNFDYETVRKSLSQSTQSENHMLKRRAAHERLFSDILKGLQVVIPMVRDFKKGLKNYLREKKQ